MRTYGLILALTILGVFSAAVVLLSGGKMFGRIMLFWLTGAISR